jgi:hypothetical protein
MMRLSELRGVLYQLEQFAFNAGNADPIVEMYHGDQYMQVDLNAISNDPSSNLLPSGTIHIPMVTIDRRGYAITYRTETGENSIIMRAESKAEAQRNFEKFFKYELLSIDEEV